MIISWPSNTPELAIDEVNRLLKDSFKLEHCIRGKNCSDSSNENLIYIQLMNKPKHLKASFILAIANRETKMIGIFGDFVQEVTKTYDYDRAYKIAIGRIAAHEIVHQLIPCKDHWGNSIMRSHINREMLEKLNLFPLDKDDVPFCGGK